MTKKSPAHNYVRAAALAGLGALTLLLNSCVTSASERRLEQSLFLDGSVGSPASEANATTTNDVLLRKVIRRRGTLRWYVLDEQQGARLIAKFTPVAPERKSRAGIAAWERRSLQEGKRLFAQAVKTAFANTPRGSPLALGITVIGRDMHHDEQTEAALTIISDGRDMSILDMECGAITEHKWQSRLDERGLLTPSSLSNLHITFLGMNPVAPIAGQRCQPSMKRSDAIEALWRHRLERAGASVTFAPETDISEDTAVIVMMTGSFLLFWRKLRVKRRARRDRSENRYSPLAIILELIGPRPIADFDDPKYEQLALRMRVLQASIEVLRERVYAIRDALAKFVCWLWPALGIVFCYGAEWLAWVLLLADAGVRSPDRWFIAAPCALVIIVAVCIAAEHEREDGSRPWWYRLLLTFLGIVCFAITVFRVSNAMTGDAAWWEEAALGAILLVGSLGPAIGSEYLAHLLRPILPLVGQRAECQRRLRREQRELRQITEELSESAKLRREWDWEKDLLAAVYDGVNPPPNNQQPTGATTCHSGS